MFVMTRITHSLRTMSVVLLKIKKYCLRIHCPGVSLALE